MTDLTLTEQQRDSLDNLGIWRSLEKTDPKYTKGNTQGGRQSTSINGLYMAKKATEAFGPIGIGWGYEILEERQDDAGPIMSKDENPENVREIMRAKTHTILLKLWYMVGDQRGEVTQYGHTRQVYQSKFGYTVDDEAPKKSLTDAMKKCLSLVGVCADIYLGEFDDHGYRSEAQQEANIKRQEEEIERQEKAAEEWRAQVREWLDQIESAKTLKEMATIFGKAARRANTRGDEAAMKALAKAKAKKEKELDK